MQHPVEQAVQQIHNKSKWWRFDFSVQDNMVIFLLTSAFQLQVKSEHFASFLCFFLRAARRVRDLQW